MTEGGRGGGGGGGTERRGASSESLTPFSKVTKQQLNGDT